MTIQIGSDTFVAGPQYRRHHPSNAPREVLEMRTPSLKPSRGDRVREFERPISLLRPAQPRKVEIIGLEED